MGFHLRSALLCILLFIGQRADAAITVSDAKIAGGRLVVTGTSDVGDLVSLDGYYTAEVANKAFSFSLIYVPASCIVSLGAPGTTTPNIRAVVANCAPTPVNAMGEWQNDTRYQPHDLVERQGGHYIALTNPRPNLNEDPLYATSFWRAVPVPNTTADQTLLMGPKGERGEAGHDGAKGDDGALAPYVLHTLKAEITKTQTENGASKSEWKVISRGSLAVKVGNDTHDQMVDLLIPFASVPDFEACTLAATLFEHDGDKSQAGIGRLKRQNDMVILPVRTANTTTHIDALLLCPKAK